MMTRNPSKRRALVKYALAVPIFLVLTLLLASPKTQVMATTEAATDKVVASIETFEKNWATTEHVDNEVITPNGLAKLLNDTVIAETPQLVFTVDGKTPSSQQVMSLQDIHNRNEFSMSASAKTDKGKLQRVKMIGLTVVRISLKSGTTQASNTSMVFTADMKKLVQMAEIGDTYQFIGKGKLANDDNIQDYTFTYYIGERPIQPRLDALDAQQQAELVKISESPVVLLAGKRGGIITAEDLTKQDKLEAYQVVNGKNIPVNIQSFVMFRAIAGGQEVMQSNNTGGQFSPETKRMIAMASKNDSYQFMDVQCKIQSGIDAVNAGSLTFVVKNAANPQGMAIADGLFVSLEDETGNALYLTEKALKIKELAAPYNKLKIVQMTSGIPHQLEVEEFIIIRIREKENPIRIRNNGSKFNNEVAQIFKDATDGDMFQIMNMRTIEKAPKIAARTWTIEKAPPQYSAAKDTSDPVFTIVEEMAEFVGGLDSMFRFLGRNIHYPPEARTLKVEGTIYIGFIVEKDGSLTNFKVKRNLPESVIETVKVLSVDGGVTGSKVVKRQDQSCATEAIRVLSLMPKWKAAKSKGVPVRVAYTLPIKFKLE